MIDQTSVTFSSLIDSFKNLVIKYLFIIFFDFSTDATYLMYDFLIKQFSDLTLFIRVLNINILLQKNSNKLHVVLYKTNFYL